MGADAVLLIVAALADDELRRLHGLVGELGMDALVEVHDESELDRALDLGADLIGVNQRDLKTFEIDRALAARLAARMPAGVIKVGESGIRDERDAKELFDAGYDAILVGETFVTSPDPTAAVRSLLCS